MGSDWLRAVKINTGSGTEGAESRLTLAMDEQTSRQAMPMSPSDCCTTSTDAYAQNTSEASSRMVMALFSMFLKYQY